LYSTQKIDVDIKPGARDAPPLAPFVVFELPGILLIIFGSSGSSLSSESE